MAKKTVTHSPMFDKLKERYDKGYIRNDQLKRYVDLGVITADEYKEITGEDYE